jgi:hypothetical protein
MALVAVNFSIVLHSVSRQFHPHIYFTVLDANPDNEFSVLCSFVWFPEPNSYGLDVDYNEVKCAAVDHGNQRRCHHQLGL